jgi:hypothetical protein
VDLSVGWEAFGAGPEVLLLGETGVGSDEEVGEDMLDEVPASELFFARRLEPESTGMLDEALEEPEVDAPDGVTIEEILSMVRCDTPAFERSEALE